MEEGIRVVPKGALQSAPSTTGMTRMTAVSGERIWLGEVHTSPGAVSGWHHHGNYTTYGRVIAGKIRFDFGPGGGESLEAGHGDFFVVPPGTVHRESNPGSEEQLLVGIRTGKGPTIVNVAGPDST